VAREAISVREKMRLKSAFDPGASLSFSDATATGVTLAFATLSALAKSVVVTVVAGASAFFGSVEALGAAIT